MFVLDLLLEMDSFNVALFIRIIALRMGLKG